MGRFDTQKNLAWHQRAGFDAVFVTDHNTTAGLVPTDPGRRARFGSSGLNNTQVSLQLSPVADLVDGAGNLLQLTRLDLDSGGNLRTLTPSSQTFFVGIGGEVFVAANQAEGIYDGTFTLTADYL